SLPQRCRRRPRRAGRAGAANGGANMSAPQRRGACPGLSAPMETGDGLLVRFAPEDAIAPDEFIALCAAARAHGNGTIEITARGSLQVRGLTPRSAPLFARAVAALSPRPEERAQRASRRTERAHASRRIAPDGAMLLSMRDSEVSILVDPLPDDPDVLIDSTALARELRRAIADARLALAPKACVILDVGG